MEKLDVHVHIFVHLQSTEFQIRMQLWKVFGDNLHKAWVSGITELGFFLHETHVVIIQKDVILKT